MHYSALLLLPALLFPAAQSDKTPQPEAMPADLVDDSYAIYSQMMGEGSPDGDRWVAISEITQESTSESFGPELCLRPPDSDRAAFDEVLKDFERRHETVVKLEPRFHLSGNYRLITKKEVDVITGSRKWWGGGQTRTPAAICGCSGDHLVEPGLFRCRSRYGNRVYGDRMRFALWHRRMGGFQEN